GRGGRGVGERKMRLDQWPRSDNVEDRRSEEGGAGFRIPGGRGGLGIGTIIVLGLVGYWLGIDPSVLIGGAEILSGGGSSQQQSNPGPRDSAGARDTGAPSDQMGQFASAVHGDAVAEDFRAIRQNLRAADARDVLRRHALGLRVRAIRDGAVLLPERPQGLSRHLVLSGSRATLPRLRRRQQVLSILAGLRDLP